MYPITYSWKKSLTSFLVLCVFGYLMIAASSFYVAPDPIRISDTFLMQDTAYANHVLELNQVGLVPVDVTDGIAKYVVQRGDTLSAIAAQFGTTVEQLQETNGIRGVLRV
jgi:LysM repeat protein